MIFSKHSDFRPQTLDFRFANLDKKLRSDVLCLNAYPIFSFPILPQITPLKSQLTIQNGAK